MWWQCRNQCLCDTSGHFANLYPVFLIALREHCFKVADISTNVHALPNCFCPSTSMFEKKTFVVLADISASHIQYLLIFGFINVMASES